MNLINSFINIYESIHLLNHKLFLLSFKMSQEFDIKKIYIWICETIKFQLKDIIHTPIKPETLKEEYSFY